MRSFYSFYRCRRIHDGYKLVKRLGVGAVRSDVFHSAVLHIFNVCELLLVGRACRGKNTDAYSEAHKHYDELKKLSLTAKCRGGLWSFADITLMTNSKAHGQRF